MHAMGAAHVIARERRHARRLPCGTRYIGEPSA
jgi:hypothetical protein